MIKKSLIMILLASGSFIFHSCRETVKEETVREVEVEEQVDVEEDEGILERTGSEIDDEVNQEINEEIDQIGNDDQ